MLKKEYEVLKPLSETPWRKLTFKQIEKSSRKKSKSYLFKTLKKFVKEAVLKEERVGKTVLYSIKYGSVKALSYFGFILEYSSFKKKNIPFQNLENIISKIPAKFFVLIITGSYARGQETKGSDLDIVILCDDALDPKRIYAELRYECEMQIPQIHLYVFTREEFMKMLLEKKQNYGKEIARNALVLQGGREYLDIMKEAIEHGFNG